MAQTSMTRAYALGLGYGNFWLVSAGLAFAILDMFNINTTPQGTLFSLLGVVLIGGILLYLCARFLYLSYRLPRASTGRISATGRRIFLGLILLEVIGWSVLDATLGSHTLSVWIVPIDLLIIAAHFIPLAFVFKVPAYLIMGILWIVAVIGTMLVFPSTTSLGHVSIWMTIPSLCCVAITWITSLYLLTTQIKEVRVVSQNVVL